MYAGSIGSSHNPEVFPKLHTSHSLSPSLILRNTGLPTSPKMASQDSVLKQDPVIQKLRDGDEDAYEALITQYYASMIRVALQYVPTRAVADEVVQETWVGFLQSLQRFEGRCSIKTWLFRILTNRAKTRGAQEHRYVPLPGEGHDKEDSHRFEGGIDSLVHGQSHHNSSAALPDTCDHDDPEQHLLTKEGVAHIESAIQALPPRLRQIILLRDVEGWGAEEVCELLHLSEGNQRVLLHRARVRVRDSLAPIFHPSHPESHCKKICNG